MLELFQFSMNGIVSNSISIFEIDKGALWQLQNPKCFSCALPHCNIFVTHLSRFAKKCYIKYSKKPMYKNLVIKSLQAEILKLDSHHIRTHEMGGMFFIL